MKRKKALSTNVEMGFIFAVISSIFFSLNVPVSKMLLEDISPYWLASLLYFGAGIGTYFFHLLSKNHATSSRRVSHQGVWYGLMILLDIFAPILFLIGVKEINGSTVGLLANAELIFTLILAVLIFKEKLSGLSIMATILIGLGLVSTNYQISTFQIEVGSIWILLGTFCWGLENNISKKLSFGNPLVVVILKGIGTGIGTFVIALLLNEVAPSFGEVGWSLIAGFLIYGVSLIFYVNAQRTLGAAKVQLIQSFAPILGGLFSWMLFQEPLSISTILGYILVIFALSLIGMDSKKEGKQ